VKVVVRCRPLFGKEVVEKRGTIVKVDVASGQVAITNPDREKDPPKMFTFDLTYDENTIQKNFYDESAFPLVESVMEGFNGTIFAYGQTGCGKTYTMQGKKDPYELRGVIPNSFDHIFDCAAATEKERFLIRCSYLEIYNEEIRDLLATDTKAKLDLRENPDKGTYVNGLIECVCATVDEVNETMDRGFSARTVASTLMNAESSRSHSIFTVVVEVSTQGDEDGEERVRAGKLNLVDLAGSERQKKTGASGATLKEGAKINLSLSALGNVISSLVDAKKGKHIPYRDSKLTRLLQDSLGGNTKTVMVAAISPADYNYDETMSTLRYANRAKNIKNKPVINEDPKDAMLRSMADEITLLKEKLAQMAAGGMDPSMMAATLAAMSLQAPAPAPQAAHVAAPQAAHVAAPQAAPMLIETPINTGAPTPSDTQQASLQRNSSSANEDVGAPAAADSPRANGIVSQVTQPPPSNVVPQQQAVRPSNLITDHEASENQESYDLDQSYQGSAEIHEDVNLMGPSVGLMGASITYASSPKMVIKEKVIIMETEQHKAQMKALDEYNKALAMQRDGMGEEIETIEAAQKAERAYRENLEKQLQMLENRVGHKKRNVGDEARIKVQSRKAELQEAATKKEAEKLKRRSAKRKDKEERDNLRSELEDLHREFELDRDSYLETMREQNRHIQLLQQLVDKAYMPDDISKVYDCAKYDDSTEKWILPPVEPSPILCGDVSIPSRKKASKEYARPIELLEDVVPLPNLGKANNSNRKHHSREKDRGKDRHREKKRKEKRRRKKHKDKTPARAVEEDEYPDQDARAQLNSSGGLVRQMSGYLSRKIKQGINSVSPTPGLGNTDPPPMPLPLSDEHEWNGGEHRGSGEEIDEWADGWEDEGTAKTSSWDNKKGLPLLQGQNDDDWQMESLQTMNLPLQHDEGVQLRHAEPVPPSGPLPGLRRERASTQYYSQTPDDDYDEYDDDDEFQLEASNELPSIDINGKKVRSWIPLTAQERSSSGLSNEQYSDGYVVSSKKKAESGANDRDYRRKTTKERLPPPLL